jgi:hypothetical protein
MNINILLLLLFINNLPSKQWDGMGAPAPLFGPRLSPYLCCNTVWIRYYGAILILQLKAHLRNSINSKKFFKGPQTKLTKGRTVGRGDYKSLMMIEMWPYFQGVVRKIPNTTHILRIWPGEVTQSVTVSLARISSRDHTALSDLNR